MIPEPKQRPTGSGIYGRPILHDLLPGVSHLAFYHRGTWYTWCGETVPHDHMCPTDDEVAEAPPYYKRNCHQCFVAYMAGKTPQEVLAGIPVVRHKAN